MEVRTLEALFSFNIDLKQFEEATKSVDKFAHNVQDVVNEMAKRPIQVNIHFDSEKAEAVKKEVDDFSAGLQKIMVSMAGYFAFDQVKTFLDTTLSNMAQIGKTASFIGISTDALQELRYAADQSGVSIDGLEDALKEIQIRAVDALSGSGEAFDAFKKVDVKPKDAFGAMRDPLDLLSEVADKLKQLPTHAERLWVVDSMFGDEGSKMLTMLQNGSENLNRMRKEARLFGAVLGDESIAKAHQFNNALNRMRVASQGASNAFVTGFLGPFTWAMEKLSALATAFNQLEGRASIVRVALLTLSGVVSALAIKAAIALAPLIIPFLVLTAVIAGVAIIAEDLWVAFKGGDSVIGSTFKGMSRFAQEAQLALTKGFKDAFVSIHKEFAKFSDWITTGLARLSQKAQDLLAGLVPDFVKNGLFATVKHSSGAGHHQSAELNRRLAPTLSSMAQQNRYSSNQNVNVAVNVKSGADPREIGGEVSKAVKKELERERFNAFMGVTQYAG